MIEGKDSGVSSSLCELVSNELRHGQRMNQQTRRRLNQDVRKDSKDRRAMALRGHFHVPILFSQISLAKVTSSKIPEIQWKLIRINFIISKARAGKTQRQIWKMQLMEPLAFFLLS